MGRQGRVFPRGKIFSTGRPARSERAKGAVEGVVGKRNFGTAVTRDEARCEREETRKVGPPESHDDERYIQEKQKDRRDYETVKSVRG